MFYTIVLLSLSAFIRGASRNPNARLSPVHLTCLEEYKQNAAKSIDAKNSAAFAKSYMQFLTVWIDVNKKMIANKIKDIIDTIDSKDLIKDQICYRIFVWKWAICLANLLLKYTGLYNEWNSLKVFNLLNIYSKECLEKNCEHHDLLLSEYYSCEPEIEQLPELPTSLWNADYWLHKSTEEIINLAVVLIWKDLECISSSRLLDIYNMTLLMAEDMSVKRDVGLPMQSLNIKDPEQSCINRFMRRFMNMVAGTPANKTNKELTNKSFGLDTQALSNHSYSHDRISKTDRSIDFFERYRNIHKQLQTNTIKVRKNSASTTEGLNLLQSTRTNDMEKIFTNYLILLSVYCDLFLQHVVSKDDGKGRILDNAELEIKFIKVEMKIRGTFDKILNNARRQPFIIVLVADKIENYITKCFEDYFLTCSNGSLFCTCVVNTVMRYYVMLFNLMEWLINWGRSTNCVYLFENTRGINAPYKKIKADIHSGRAKKIVFKTQSEIEALVYENIYVISSNRIRHEKISGFQNSSNAKPLSDRNTKTMA